MILLQVELKIKHTLNPLTKLFFSLTNKNKTLIASLMSLVIWIKCNNLEFSFIKVGPMFSMTLTNSSLLLMKLRAVTLVQFVNINIWFLYIPHMGLLFPFLILKAKEAGAWLWSPFLFQWRVLQTFLLVTVQEYYPSLLQVSSI